MKKLFILIMCFVLCSFSGCHLKGGQTNVDSTDSTEVVLGQGPMMIVGESIELNEIQIDSLCEAEGLPFYRDWIRNDFKDSETGQYFIRYMCIKYEEDKETVFVITDDSELPYPYTKRITYK